MNRSLLLAIACLTVLTALTTSASAQVTCWPYPINNPTTQRCSGPVQGTVTYYEHQGNYCDTAGGHSCADTTFVVADHLALRPLKNMKVYVLDGDTSAVLATTQTDSAGKFNTYWISDRTPRWVYLQVRFEHKDGRFNLRNTAGGAVTSNSLSALVGTAGPVILNNTYGSFALGHKHANLFAGAELMWSSLDDSNIMLNDFNNLAVLAFFALDQKGPNELAACNTSCFKTGMNMLMINTNDAFRPQGRIWHEMGHAASEVAEPRTRTADYLYIPPGGWTAAAYVAPNPTPSPSWVNGPNGGWNRDTPEHYSSGFEEAYATFLGDRANYRKTATQPLTCLLEELPCDNTDQWNQIETSRGAYANCAPVERRMPISAMRYLRDAYDDTPNGDSTDVSFQGMIRTIRQFPNGTADRQDSEAGNDGFNADDFRYQLLQSEGVNSQSILDANCKPYI